MKTATVDLFSSRVEIVETPEDTLRQFMGGRGLGAKLLYDLVGPDVEPLSPGNVLIFTAGPLAGTPWPTSARLHVTFKSPLTGAYGYANSGGFFAAEMRHAGYDAILITGRAPQPSVLRVQDGDIHIEAAPDLWGQTTEETHQVLLGPEPKAKDGRVACIGPAGENLVRISAIINDHNRAAARGGPGAVMGSKNLKAIHIRASSRPLIPPELRMAAKAATAKLSDDARLDGLRQLGTLFLMEPKNLSGDQPAKNHQLAQVPFIDEVGSAAMDNYLVEHKGCYACPIRCSRKSRVSEGPYAVEIGGPEYETTNALGPMCWIDDPEAIIYANHLCNLYGLDTISTGVVIAFAMELHEKGRLDDPELSLEWGDEDTLTGLIERIAYRQGADVVHPPGERRPIGDLLAEGVRGAAQWLGGEAERYALHVKGLELPRQEPRVAKGFGLGHATSNRGADHLYALPAIDLGGAWDTAKRIFPAEIVPELMETDNEKFKADMVVYGEHYCAVTDALGICKFSTTEEYSLLPDDVAPGLAAVWDEPLTGDDLLQLGERIVNLERLYNVRQGLSRADDRLPARFTEETVPLFGFERDPESGSLQQSAEPIGEAQLYDFEAMLDRYYDLRGWSRDGVPTPDTLQRLGLEAQGRGVV
ncbi:MAG: aldehyde ferredoxin oxidoreductase family protein [Anaerolineae bacterium]|jgi:aldehyde:ferredoxin oxidoreductase